MKIYIFRFETSQRNSLLITKALQIRRQAQNKTESQKLLKKKKKRKCKGKGKAKINRIGMI